MLRILTACLLVLASASFLELSSTLTGGVYRLMSDPASFARLLFATLVFFGLAVFSAQLVTLICGPRRLAAAGILSVTIDFAALAFWTMPAQSWSGSVFIAGLGMGLASIILILPRTENRKAERSVLGAAGLAAGWLLTVSGMEVGQGLRDRTNFASIAGTWAFEKNGERSVLRIDTNGRFRAIEGRLSWFRGRLHHYDLRRGTVVLTSFHIDSQSEGGPYNFRVNGDKIEAGFHPFRGGVLHRISEP